MQYATFEIDDQLFGVDVATVQEVFRFQEYTPVPLAPHCVNGLINLRGQVITALDLRVRMGLPPRPADELPMNVVVRVDDEPVSLLVDRIGDVVELYDDTFEPPPDTLSGGSRELIVGAFKLERRLVLALDVRRAVDTTTDPNQGKERDDVCLPRPR